MHANAQIFFWSYRLKKKICVIKLQSKELYWKLQLIWQTTLVSKWTNSWQPRDARDILFTAIQRYIDSGKDAVLCSIKRPLKIHFAFGNNNEISVSIPGSGVRLAIFCSRVFCQRFNGDEEKFDFLRLSGQLCIKRHCITRQGQCVRGAAAYYLGFLFINFFILSPSLTFPLQTLLK